MSRTSALVAVIAALLLAACGSDDSSDTSTSKTTSTTAKTAAATTEAAKAKMIAQCHTALDPIVIALRNVDTQLEAADSYPGYSAAVANMRATFRHINFQGTSGSTCLQSVVVPAQRAFNEYIAARTIWSACVKRESCDKAALAPKLAEHRTTASGFLDAASSAFAGVTAT